MNLQYNIEPGLKLQVATHLLDYASVESSLLSFQFVVYCCFYYVCTNGGSIQLYTTNTISFACNFLFDEDLGRDIS